MTDMNELRQELESARDEILLKIHLASMDVKDEWAGLEKQWDDFSSRAQVKESSEAVGGALSHLGQELKNAYTRIRGAID